MNAGEKMILLGALTLSTISALGILVLILKNRKLNKKIDNLEALVFESKEKENEQSYVESSPTSEAEATVIEEVETKSEEVSEVKLEIISKEELTADILEVEDVMEEMTKEEESETLELGDELSLDILKAFNEGICTISVYGIRKHFNIGYSRASRIMNNLEDMGLILQGEDGKRSLVMDKTNGYIAA